MKFCKDLGESSRKQTLLSARTSARKFPGGPREGYTSQEVQVDDEAQEELLLPSESSEAGSQRSERIRNFKKE
jgi:hypothetical protein